MFLQRRMHLRCIQICIVVDIGAKVAFQLHSIWCGHVGSTVRRSATSSGCATKLSRYAATVASSAWTKLAAASVIASSARIEMLNGVRIIGALDYASAYTSCAKMRPEGVTMEQCPLQLWPKKELSRNVSKPPAKSSDSRKAR